MKISSFICDNCGLNMGNTYSCLGSLEGYDVHFCSHKCKDAILGDNN